MSYILGLKIVKSLLQYPGGKYWNPKPLQDADASQHFRTTAKVLLPRLTANVGK